MCFSIVEILSSVLTSPSPKSKTKGLQWPFVSSGEATPDLTSCNLRSCEFLNHIKTFQQSNFPATERLSACVEPQEGTVSFVCLGPGNCLFSCELSTERKSTAESSKCLWSKNG